MKRLRALEELPVSVPLPADDVLEHHAARLLLLLRHCGVRGQKIDSLTKMAKLDFFVRYPEFFAVAAEEEGKTPSLNATQEARMIRYHYGPWDQRYYHLLAYLEALGLVTITRKGRSFQLTLTGDGVRAADELTKEQSFNGLIQHMRQVKKVLGRKTGTRLKNLIYELFEREVAERPLGEEIE